MENEGVKVVVKNTWTAPDGEVCGESDVFVRFGDEGPRASYHQEYDGELQRSFAYCGMTDDAAFIAWASAKQQERMECAYRLRQDARERAELRAWFDTQRPILQRALDGLGTSEAIIETVAVAVEWYGAKESLERLIASESDKKLRAHLKGCYSTAREETRENYPESYREAEDKDDFYDEFKDDIAQAFAASL